LIRGFEIRKPWLLNFFLYNCRSCDAPFDLPGKVGKCGHGRTGQDNLMRQKLSKRVVLTVLAGMLVQALVLVRAQNPATPYLNMASLDQYLMEDRNAEIALAKSAAPKSISDQAEVLVLDREGYSTAVKGTNGFVCMVERSWAAGIDDPDFWNPKLRGPICFNPPAVRSYLPITVAKTKLVLAGKSKAQMFEAIEAALDKKELPSQEPGAMSYMLSKDGYLAGTVGHWHPHLMFFVPQTDAKTWGANLAGSPVVEADDPQDRLTIFMVLVAKWSDGTLDSGSPH
jgi:hypothetical protein